MLHHLQHKVHYVKLCSIWVSVIVHQSYSQHKHHLCQCGDGETWTRETFLRSWLLINCKGKVSWKMQHMYTHCIHIPASRKFLKEIILHVFLLLLKDDCNFHTWLVRLWYPATETHLCEAFKLLGFHIKSWCTEKQKQSCEETAHPIIQQHKHMHMDELPTTPAGADFFFMDSSHNKWSFLVTGSSYGTLGCHETVRSAAGSLHISRCRDEGAGGSAARWWRTGNKTRMF